MKLKSKIYDFVVFENCSMATNHHKDVGLIADLLQSSGYTVAIADVYPGLKDISIKGVSHVPIHCNCNLLEYHNKGIRSLWPCLKITSFINQLREARYLRSVMRELEGSYKHLYCGSYYVKMPIGWLKCIPQESSAFFWGLRSSRLVQFKMGLSIRALFSYRLREYFDKHNNLKFFVSDRLIYSEFLKLGIQPDRLVIRPERYINDYSEPTICQRSSFSLLSIGSLRPSKRIERIVSAVKSLNDHEICYTIAGCASSEYENVIKKEIGENGEVIERLNYRLSEEDYKTLLSNADFLVLCDKQQESNVTNGTMNEALLSGVPIIAPNYAPYDYFIKQFGIGISFNPDLTDSLALAIQEAKRKGRSSFQDAIHKYQKQFIKADVVKEFSQSLKCVILSV